MHNIYGIIYIISNIILLISSAPATNELQHRSIYDVLIEHSLLKCPYLKATELLEPTPSFLKHCSDYSTLKSVKSLTRETEYDILCIVYMNNYMNLCDIFPTNSTVDNKDIKKAVDTSKLEKTCESLSTSKLNDNFKDAANVLSNFKSPETCKSLCKELTDSRVTPICSLAAFTLNIANQIQRDRVKIQPKEKPQKSENGDQSKPVNKDKQPVVVPKPKITNNNNDQVNDLKLPQNEHDTQNAGQINPPVELTQKIVDVPEKPQGAQPPVGPMVPGTDLSSRNGGETKDNAIKPNPVTAQNKNSQSGSNPKDETSQDGNVIPPSTEVSTTKVSDVKKMNTDETQENQQGKPELPNENGKLPQEVPSAQNLPSQTETDSAPVQNAKSSDNADVKDNIPFDGQQDEAIPNSEDDAMEDEGDAGLEPENSLSSKTKQQPKPQETNEDTLPYNNSNSDEEDSFFFIYFMMVCAVFILGYLGYHNKQKVLALVIEGRRGRRGSRRGRPNSANYHKLDSNLEEAVTSSCNKNSTNIIY